MVDLAGCYAIFGIQSRAFRSFRVNCYRADLMKILVASGSGLTGKSLGRNSNYFPEFEFYFHFRKDGDLSSPIVVRDLLKKVSPDVIIVNAASLVGARGPADLKDIYSKNNFEIFRNFLQFASKNQQIICFSSYHVFGGRSPFSVLDTSDMNQSSDYVREKALEVECGLGNENVAFIFFPHLFGVFDNFEKDRAHFIADSIRRISEAKQTADSFLQFFGNRERILQFGTGDQAALFALELIRQGNPSHHKFFNGNIGWSFEIGKIFETLCQLIDFSGEIRVEDAPTNDLQSNRNMYFDQSELHNSIPNSFVLALQETIDYYNRNTRGGQICTIH